MKLLAIDDDSSFLLSIKAQLISLFQVDTAQCIKTGLKKTKEDSYDIILLDICLGSESGLNYLEQLKSISPYSEIIVVSGQKNPKLMLTAMEKGAFDYLVKPFDPDELQIILRKIKYYQHVQSVNHALIDGNSVFHNMPIIGQSKKLQKSLLMLKKIKKHQKAHVLIEGESGTGKELFARAVHSMAKQNDRPFVAINCAAIPENLLEAELFGYEKGAFTGATSSKAGKFEIANRGDLFLDEVSSLKPELQAKLLRIIQEGEVHRLGSLSPRKVNVRIISATNEHLENMIDKQLFRRDLLHRLRVIHFQLPPLRERMDDLDILIAHFFKKKSPDLPWTINSAAMHALKQYPWPGNVRELENLIHSLTILMDHHSIGVTDLPKWIFNCDISLDHQPDTALEKSYSQFPVHMDDIKPLKHWIKFAEKEYINHILMLTGQNRTIASSKLDICESSLYKKLKSNKD